MSVFHQMMTHPRNNLTTRIDIAEEDISLLDTDDVDSVTPEDKPTDNILQNENAQWDIIHDSKASVITVDVIDPSKISLLDTTPDDGLDMEEEMRGPSGVISYFNEAALKSKDRNSLPDDVFGIPRLRAYPLNDKAHVQQAIRMFGHCKDKKDRKLLATRIFDAMNKFGITTKIGKTNDLYTYAPEALREDNEVPQMIITGLGTPLGKRTRKQVVEEHMRVNRAYYNNIFYGPEFAKSVQALKEYPFFDYFWPDLQRMNFSTRLETVCGGFASSAMADTMYHNLGIRKPLCTDFNKPLGWVEITDDESREDIEEVLYYTEYDTDANWFKADLSKDVNHSLFCMRLYSIMGEILLNPHFDPSVNMTEKHHALLMDWGQKIAYHYDLYLEAKPDSQEQINQMQYLWDLFWCYLDSPYMKESMYTNLIHLIRNMACIKDKVITMNEANDPGELVSRDKCSAYLVHELGMSDHMFLLPDTMEYPIIDKMSVRLAMDMVNQIPEDQRNVYVKRLNQKYKELGCNFSISVDHPFARYADENVVEHMTHMLLENNTAVDDEGTSTGRPERVTQPWYKRFDHNKGLDINVLDNHELGPNQKKVADPEYTVHTSIL